MATVQTSALPQKAGNQTHYLSRTDGERTQMCVAIQGLFLAQQHLQASVYRFEDRPGEVTLALRCSAFSLHASMTAVEAELMGAAITLAAAHARESLKALVTEEVPA